MELLPTIETCFNCFGIRSSDAKEIIKRRQNRPGNSKVTQPLSTPPLLGGEGGVAKMAPVPEGEIFCPPHCFNIGANPSSESVRKRIL